MLRLDRDRELELRAGIQRGAAGGRGGRPAGGPAPPPRARPAGAGAAGSPPHGRHRGRRRHRERWRPGVPGPGARRLLLRRHGRAALGRPDVDRPRPPRGVDRRRRGRRRPAPLSYDADDAWDRRFLSDAIELGNELEARSKGFSAQVSPGRRPHRRVPARGCCPTSPPSPTFVAALFDPKRAPGESLVGAAIALEGTRGTFAERWAGVFGFRDEGAQWGLVALDQGVTRVPLLAAGRRRHRPRSPGLRAHPASRPVRRRRRRPAGSTGSDGSDRHGTRRRSPRSAASAHADRPGAHHGAAAPTPPAPDRSTPGSRSSTTPSTPWWRP